MLKVGLTGGIGCGKSTAVDAFRVLGVPIVDADKIAKDIVKPGQQALKEIVKTFGDEILLDSGELDRALLKQKIFSDSKTLEKLEVILHPKIRKEIKQQISTFDIEPYVIVDIPLLVEKKYQEMFDRVIVVDCFSHQQIERVNLRDNMTEADIKTIVNTQVKRKERLAFATDILDNTDDVDTLRAQIKNLHKKFLQS